MDQDWSHLPDSWKPGEANPFDTIDAAPATKAPAAAPQIPAPAQPAPQAATTSVSADAATQPQDLPAGWAQTQHTVEMTPDQVEREKRKNADIAALVNSNLSDDDVRAKVDQRMRQEGQTLADVQGLDAALKWRAVHRSWNGPVLTQHTADQQDAPTGDPEKDGGGGALGSFARGASNALTLGADRWIHGLGAGVGSAISGDQSFGDAMSHGRQDWDAVLNYDANHHGLAQVGGELAGSLALPGGPEAGAARRIAKGAGQAGVYGFLQGEHSIGDRLENAGVNAAVGASIGTALEGGGALAGRMLRGSGENRAAAQDTMAAADRLNASAPAGEQIVPMAANVGGPAVRGATSALKHTIVGGPLVEGGLDRFVSATEAARNRIADSVAPGVSQTGGEAAAGKLVGDADSWESAWRAANDKNYSRALWLAADEPLTATNTINALDNRIGELSGAPGNPNAAAIDKLQSLRDDLANNTYTADKLRLTRSDWGKSVDASDGVSRGMAKTIYGTLTQDIDSGLRNAGRVGAAQHFARADQAYSEGLDFLHNDLPRIVGRDGNADPDAILANINSAVANGRSSVLSRVLDAADPTTAAQIRGSIIARLGRGSVNPETGAAGFSAPGFIRQWDKLSDTAKQSLFDQPTISALNDVRTLATAAKRAGTKDNNSKTAATYANRTLIDGLVHLATTGGHAFTGGGTLLGQLGSEAGIGFLLSRPGVARALAGAARTGDNTTLARRVSAAVGRFAAQAPGRVARLPYTAAAAAGVSDSEPQPGLAIGPHDHLPDEWQPGQPNPFDQM